MARPLRQHPAALGVRFPHCICRPSAPAARHARAHRHLLDQHHPGAEPALAGTRRRCAQRTCRIAPRAGPCRRPPSAATSHQSAGTTDAHHRAFTPLTRPNSTSHTKESAISAPAAHHRELLDKLTRYLNDSEKILAAWDIYSDDHVDEDGWPLDGHAYGLRASRRDADTDGAFQPLRAGAHHLLSVAERQLVALPARSVNEGWVWKLGNLRTALASLDGLAAEWHQDRERLGPNAGPGTPRYEAALAEHLAESWGYLDDWAGHGHALLDIHSAAQAAPSVLAPPPPKAVATPTTAPAARSRG